MALINPELIALARIKFVVKSDGQIDLSPANYPSYDFSNGFDAVEVAGALPGALPIIATLDTLEIFLSVPQEPGNPRSLPSTLPSQAGVKATFDIVRVSTATDPSPVGLGGNSVVFDWQYGDYALSGLYANVNPQKALKAFLLLTEGDQPITAYVDVSVFKNPMTLYK